MTSRSLPSLLTRAATAFAALALAGLASAANNIVSGSATFVAGDIQHPNGNIYDQVQLTGQSAVLRTDGNKILRCSFVDPNGDIVQCEFSGPGEFTITLDPSTYVGLAPPAKYNQPGVTYVTGRATVSITNSTANTYVTIFSVGKGNAVNQALFPANETYDAVADIQRIEVTGSEIAAILAGNTRFGGSAGLTGIFAPNTNVAKRVVLHDIKASGSATPVLQVGSGSTLADDAGSILLAGGDLSQPNGASIDITPGNGQTLASIVTVANVRSDGSNVQRVNIASTVNWISGGSGTLLVDGVAVFEPSTGGSSGQFAATFSDLIASPNSPFKFDGDINIKWVFSGGNNGTWSVETSTETQGIATKSTISGTYTYEVASDGSSFSFTLNYDQITASTSFGPGFTLPINASSNPPMPKSVAMTATSTGPGQGTFEYTLTKTNGEKTTISGTFSPQSPLLLPAS